VAPAEEDDPQPAASPITAHTAAAAAIPRRFLVDSNRRTLGRHACLVIIAEADDSGEDAAGAAPASAELPATGGPDVELEKGSAEFLSWSFVGS
jgi:hypothetical protein